MAGSVGLPSVARLERVLYESVSFEPDSERIDRPDWVQVRTPSSNLNNHNLVLRARLHPDKVERKVAEVAADHAARGAQYRWVVGPSSTPEALCRHIEAAGLIQTGGDGVGMAMAIRANDPPLAVPGLTVERMVASNVDEHADITARAWERGADFRDAISRVSRRAITVPDDAPVRGMAWIASLDGEPVAASHLRLLPDLGYLQGAAVLPSHRGRGIYRALIHHRMGVLRRLGRHVAVIWADAKGSAIVCRKVGFTELARATFYESV